MLLQFLNGLINKLNFTSKKSIRLFKPSLGKRELKEVRKSFKDSWIGLGPKVKIFENMWSDYLGCKSAYALNSATAALHLSLSVFKFKPGKKVLVPSLTFSSTASAVLYNNLIPVFVDCDINTLSMDIDDLDRKFDEDCVAIIPVHYSGHPCKMESIVPWARSRKLKIIEDCAHTAGSIYKGKRLGLWGDIGCFSFEEKKLLTTGDGGMICSNDKDLLKNLPSMRWVGIDKDTWKSAKSYVDNVNTSMHWYYEINQLGYKYNMNDLSASLGIIQLERLNYFLKKRSQIIKRYLNKLKNCPHLIPLVPYEPDIYSYQIFGIRTKYRDELIKYLKKNRVATGCHYSPLHLQPLFKQYKSSCPNLESQADLLLTLPFHVDLSFRDIDFISKKIYKFLSTI
ncbi:DegT/DnrJ/EryC1/StrS family aminotransferase [Prochlorococcus marinus]|uniref:DegT/DnrJ/EryC1/StrS family aminotransferase n=1 Tax=Prochlorococcus marinus TaxID=1219 RepID=UPI001ADB52F4|nr:DegT/DnrJ/EryC1/StrS family aminotransferase [Prochlorococcus marinus]MBO8219551.1 DegT/DnrJ/EryC1/StrS family aminotransferase [Prochlorococcus marinus CUG1416]MBW3051922.1 UDP-4-amino-4-deoxy-L-arabinose-oxoglutarate aminotransferase [Prochlorococcus marinus str. MU1416]